MPVLLKAGGEGISEQKCEEGSEAWWEEFDGVGMPHLERDGLPSLCEGKDECSSIL